VYSTGGDLQWQHSCALPHVLYLSPAHWEGRDWLAVAAGGTSDSDWSQLAIVDLETGDAILTEVRPRSAPTGLIAHDMDGDGEDELVRPSSCTVEVDEIERVPAASLAVGSSIAEPGAATTVAIDLATVGAPIDTLIVDLPLEESLAFARVRPGTAALAAGKTVLGGPIPGGARISVIAGGSGTLADGTVAEVQLQVADGADAGTHEVSVRVVSCADADGAPVLLSATAGEVEIVEGPPPTPTCDPPS
jgi:hypothetical protein